MGIIKTALEIALEKTENIKSDKSSIDQFEMKQKGKKLANDFLSDGADITEELKKYSSDRKKSLKQGLFDVFVTQIALPVTDEDQKRLEKTGQGLAAIIDNQKNRNEFSLMYSQLLQLVNQYLQETAHYDQALRQQYAPKLRQKEEEIARRIGREIALDPMQDPEFIAFYNQNMAALKNNYDPVIEQAKEEARRLFNNAE